MDRYGLVTLSGGNVTLRMPTGEILVTPSGMIYEDMVPEDVLVMDIEGNIIEGERKPSVDTVALLYILKHMPEVNAVIHTLDYGRGGVPRCAGVHGDDVRWGAHSI